MDGWMIGWMDGWMDEWVIRRKMKCEMGRSDDNNNNFGVIII